MPVPGVLRTSGSALAGNHEQSATQCSAHSRISPAHRSLDMPPGEPGRVLVARGEGTATLRMNTSLMLQFANGPWGRPWGELLRPAQPMPVLSGPQSDPFVFGPSKCRKSNLG